jgi:hypothetical protein
MVYAPLPPLPLEQQSGEDYITVGVREVSRAELHW